MVDSLKKAKLKWRAKRGMLELDLILESFLNHYFDQLNQDQVSTLEELISYDDPTLFEWFMGYSQPDQENLKDLVAIIQRSRSTR